MIQVSNEFKERLATDRGIFLPYIEIALTDGSVLYLDQADIWDDELTIEDAVSGSDFEIGAAISSKLSFTLNNAYGEFDGINFEQAVVTVSLGLELADGTIERLPRGVYTVDEYTEQDGETITLECLDHMCRFDFPYTDSTLQYPATLQQILLDACRMCGVELVTTTFEHSNFVVEVRPDDEALTFRDIVSDVAQIACKWARMDAYGRLELGWYDLAVLESEEGSIHTVSAAASLETAVDEVVITGIKVSAESDSDDDMAESLSGQEGYVLAVEDNPLIGATAVNTVAGWLGELLTGMKFMPCSVQHLPDPTMEPGDVVKIVGGKRDYLTVITSTVFHLADYQETRCEAQTPARKSSTQYSSQTKTDVALRKLIREEKTAREAAVENLAKLLEGSSGLYLTEEVQEDGSIIYYLHDKPTLAESATVMKLTAEAIGVSTDGGKTYPYGFTVTGEMITRVLQTEGINADWINSGTILVKASDGTVVFSADITTGKVVINADSISIGGKAVATEEYAKELAEKATNLNVILSNEYQGIPTDSSGNYTSFPECSTAIQVLYGQTDITSQCTLSATTSTGVTASLTGSTLTVTALAADSGWVDIKATYLGTMTATKRFNLSKVKDGEKGATGATGATGAAGRVYILEPSVTTIKRGQDNVPVPDEITFSAYYRDGTTASRTAYAGRFKIERSTDGNTWSTVYISSANETTCRYELYTAIEDGNGNYLEDGNGNVIVARYDEDAVMFRCTLYAAGGTTSALDMQTVPVVIDVAALTHEQIFNLLTNNGAWQGIFYLNGKMYVSGEYIAANSITADKLSVTDLYALAAKIGGWNINNRAIYKDVVDPNDENTVYRVYFQPPLTSAPSGTWVLSCQKSTDSGKTFTGNFILYSDGSAKFGNTVITANGRIYAIANGHIVQMRPATDDNTDVVSVGDYDADTNGYTLITYIQANGIFHTRKIIIDRAPTYPHIVGDGTYLQMSPVDGTDWGIVAEYKDATQYLRPANSGQVGLGREAFKWGQIWSSNSTISTSDKREKNTITPLEDDRWTQFLLGLQVVSYRLNDGTSGRLHHGLIANDVEELMNRLGIDSSEFAGFVKWQRTMQETEEEITTDERGEKVKRKRFKDVPVYDEDGNPEYGYGLRYEEFLPMTIKTVQELYRANQELKEEIESMKKGIKELKQMIMEKEG